MLQLVTVPNSLFHLFLIHRSTSQSSQATTCTYLEWLSTVHITFTATVESTKGCRVADHCTWPRIESYSQNIARVPLSHLPSLMYAMIDRTHALSGAKWRGSFSISGTNSMSMCQRGGPPRSNSAVASKNHIHRSLSGHGTLLDHLAFTDPIWLCFLRPSPRAEYLSSGL